MTGRLNVSIAVWTVLAISAALGVAALSGARRWPANTAEGAEELAALMAERETLRSCEDAVRDELRQRSAGLHRQSWTAAAIAAQRDQCGAGWAWEDRSDGAIELRRVSPQLADWPQYARVVGMLGAKPGIAIESVDLQADGSAAERRFVSVRFRLRFLRADAPMGDGARAGPSPGPPPVAAAAIPDPARKVGAGPALRPASASSRPDPPGLSAGVQTQIPTNQKPP